MIRVAILTVSDSCSQGERDDISGRTIGDILEKDGQFEICEKKIVADEHEKIAEQLEGFCDSAGVDVVLTTGGTGFGPRDVTPEATACVCDKMIPGFGEIMRSEGYAKMPKAILSRATAGIRNRTIVINLPGSAKAVKECLGIIIDLLPHAVKMARGGGH